MLASQIDKSQFDKLGFFIIRRAVSSVLTSRMMGIARDHLASRRLPFELETDVGYPGAPDNSSTVGGGTIRRLLQAYDRDPVFSEWACSDKVRIIPSILLGTDVVMLSRAHHNCIMTKQPMFSSETGWHRDIRYWAFKQPDLISIWLALGGENSENGSLKVIPGSHKMKFDNSFFNEKGFFKTSCNRELVSRKIDISLNQGDLLVFHCRTLHSAGWNRGSSAKLSLVFTYYHPSNLPVVGTRSASIDPIQIG